VWDGGATERGEGVLGREDAQPMEEEGRQDPEDRHEELPGEGAGEGAVRPGVLLGTPGMTYCISPSENCEVTSQPTTTCVLLLLCPLFP